MIEILVTWLRVWGGWLLDGVWAGVVGVASWGFDLVGALWAMWWGWVLAQVPSEFLGYVNASGLRDLFGVFDLVGAIFPVYPVLGIAVGAFAVVITIRIVRLLLGFIPTIHG